MKELWHRAPMLRLVLPLILGIVFGIVSHDFLPGFIFTSLLFTALFLILVFGWNSWKEYNSILKFGVLVNISFFVGGVCLTTQSLSRINTTEKVIQKRSEYIGKVLTYPKRTTKSLQVEMVLQESDDKTAFFGSRKIVLYASRESGLDTISPGDILVFQSQPRPFRAPINPGEFNYKAYMEDKGFIGSSFAYSGFRVYRSARKSFSLLATFKTIQRKGIELFKDSGLDDRELGVAAALVLGERSVIQTDIRDSFASAGVVHILAVSGLHVGIIYLLVLNLFNRLLPGEKLKWPRVLLVILSLWLYAGVAGLSPSVLRAATMFSFVVLGSEIGKRSSTYNMLAASALVLLILNPLLVKEVGFQLSYLAVIGIVTLYNPIYKLIVIKNYILDKIWSLTVVSFTAQLATFPLTLYYFDQFPNLFLFSNLVIIPLATISLYSGLAYLFLFWFPVVGDGLAWILNYGLFFMNEFVLFLNEISIAKSSGIHLGLFATLLLYGMFLLVPASIRYPLRLKPRVPLMFFLTLVILRGIAEIRSATSAEIWVMQNNKQLVLVSKVGKKVIALTDFSSEERRIDKEDFFISGYLTKSRVKDFKHIVSSFADSLDEGITAARIGEMQFVYLGTTPLKGIELSEKSIVLITEKAKSNMLSGALRNAHLTVLDASLSDYRRNQIIDQLDSLKIEYHDIATQGAFRLELKSIRS